MERFKRRSKDKVINVEGEILRDWMEDIVWAVANGMLAGNEEGEFTYVSEVGVSVIDYVLMNMQVWGNTERSQ